jgi:hypothetical protein
MPKWWSRADEIPMAHLSRILKPGQRIRTIRSASSACYQSREHQRDTASGQRHSSHFCKSAARSIYPNEVLLPADVAELQTDSIALCYQIRTLDKSWLEKDVCELIDAKLRQEIVEALRFQLCI